MDDELLASIEREVLGWPDVSKNPDRPDVDLFRRSYERAKAAAGRRQDRA
jgi:hypothetical protein